MLAFKTFFKIVNKYKFMIILYMAILCGLMIFYYNSGNETNTFAESKPDILIVNDDSDNKITNNLVKYLSEKCNIVNIADNEEARDDALFYQEVSYIIYIPKDYGKDFYEGKNPEINVKSLDSSNAYYAKMLLTNYLKVANTYKSELPNLLENDLIEKINTTLSKNTEINLMTSSDENTDRNQASITNENIEQNQASITNKNIEKNQASSTDKNTKQNQASSSNENTDRNQASSADKNVLNKAISYFSFLNYAVLAGLVYVICMTISAYRKPMVSKRIEVSKLNYKKFNFNLVFYNGVLTLIIWGIYIIISSILIGKFLFTKSGAILIINSLIFSICALTLAFLIANIISNKNAINGIINVVALGSSFLCGAFVPTSLLPDYVLKFAHILPSYWYIKTNNALASIETINYDTLKPLFINMLIIIAFTFTYLIIYNIVTRFFKFDRKEN